MEFGDGADDVCDAVVAGGCSGPDTAAAASEKSSSVYLSIISQQTFIGCWKLNTELSNLLNVRLDQLQNSAPVKVNFIYVLWKEYPVKSLQNWLTMFFVFIN